MSQETRKKRLLTFASIEALKDASAAAPAEETARKPPAAAPLPAFRRVTFADVAALSKRPEDFERLAPPESPPAPPEPPPAAEPPAAAAPDPAPETGAPVTGTPEEGVPDEGVPEKGIPDSGIPVPDSPAYSAQLDLVPDAALARRIRRAIKVQDGHSLGEQAVYEALWENGKTSDEDSRLLTVGYRTLSALCGLTVNNCKANLRSLAGKLAIEELAAYTNAAGRTYRVFNYPAILRRRVKAGLTHFVKTRGVIFVDPDTGEPRPLSTPEKGTPDRGIPEKGVPVSGIPEFPAITRELAQAGIAADAAAVRDLVEACRRRAAGASEEEILRFTRLKIDLIRSMGTVRNPIGFLATAVPACFEGGLTRQLPDIPTDQAAAQSPDEQARIQARKVLDDPAASDDEKRLARSILD